ncbi:hypothetical protein AM571_PC01594 (plasmid) [Rhizobium etli 8C-3]|uniref:Uncharacterized protein n=1 Tax=Rhizobium etli 8C-3 TaxID=538025 RepID=A0A1L5PGW6_RHIET|nr:hypothetical protein AM571_PC01594 [Rhizobium etli 8C-3]
MRHNRPLAEGARFGTAFSLRIVVENRCPKNYSEFHLDKLRPYSWHLSQKGIGIGAN